MPSRHIAAASTDIATLRPSRRSSCSCWYKNLRCNALRASASRDSAISGAAQWRARGLRVRGGEMLAFACLVHKPTRSAQPAEVVIRSLDECRGVLASQEFADSAGTSERSARMWMRLKMKERFFVVGTHVSRQRIEATHQRTIWMHGA